MDSVLLEVVHHDFENPYTKSAVIVTGIFDNISASDLVFLTAGCGKPLSCAIIKNRDLLKLGGHKVFEKYDCLHPCSGKSWQYDTAIGVLVYATEQEAKNCAFELDDCVIQQEANYDSNLQDSTAHRTLHIKTVQSPCLSISPLNIISDYMSILEQKNRDNIVPLPVYKLPLDFITYISTNHSDFTEAHLKSVIYPEINPALFHSISFRYKNVSKFGNSPDRKNQAYVVFCVKKVAKKTALDGFRSISLEKGWRSAVFKQVLTPGNVRKLISPKAGVDENPFWKISVEIENPRCFDAFIAKEILGDTGCTILQIAGTVEKVTKGTENSLSYCRYLIQAPADCLDEPGVGINQINFAEKILKTIGENWIENPIEIVPEEVPKTAMEVFLENIFKTGQNKKASAGFQSPVVKRRSIVKNLEKKQLNFNLPTEKDEFVYPIQEDIEEEEDANNSPKRIRLNTAVEVKTEADKNVNPFAIPGAIRGDTDDEDEETETESKPNVPQFSDSEIAKMKLVRGKRKKVKSIIRYDQRMSSDGAAAKSCQKLVVRGLHPEIEWQIEQVFSGFGYLCDVMPSSEKDDYNLLKSELFFDRASAEAASQSAIKELNNTIVSALSEDGQTTICTKLNVALGEKSVILSKFQKDQSIADCTLFVNRSEEDEKIKPAHLQSCINRHSEIAKLSNLVCSEWVCYGKCEAGVHCKSRHPKIWILTLNKQLSIGVNRFGKVGRKEFVQERTTVCFSNGNCVDSRCIKSHSEDREILDLIWPGNYKCGDSIVSKNGQKFINEQISRLVSRWDKHKEISKSELPVLYCTDFNPPTVKHLDTLMKQNVKGYLTSHVRYNSRGYYGVVVFESEESKTSAMNKFLEKEQLWSFEENYGAIKNSSLGEMDDDSEDERPKNEENKPQDLCFMIGPKIVKTELIPVDLEEKIETELDNEFIVLKQDSCYGEGYSDIWIVSIFGLVGDAEAIFEEKLLD